MSGRIDFATIFKLNLTSFEQSKLNHEEKLNKVLESDTLHLEWQNIEEIDNLELFTSIRTLYLQFVISTQNKIKVIENLDFLINLEYLSLQGNQIEYVTGLSRLENLIYLDLSKNSIQEVNFSQLPEYTMIFKLSDNPFAEREDYREIVISNLPELEELDGIPVTIQERFKSQGIQLDSYIPIMPSTQEEVPDQAINLAKNTAFMTDGEDMQYLEMHSKVEQKLLKAKERLDSLYEARNKLRESLSNKS